MGLNFVMITEKPLMSGEAKGERTMNNKTLRALSELMKPRGERDRGLMGHIANELIAPGDNEMKLLARATVPEPVSLVLSSEDRVRLKGLLCL